ncbi:MAG: DUF1538 domain-containing protein [Acetatifactor sp.]
MRHHSMIRDKMKESVSAVLPITAIVAVLCLFAVPVGSGLVLSFFLGTIMIIVGMGLFTIGADVAMTQIGNHIGARMTASRKLWLILILSFVLGVIITVAEPDLQVLATYVPDIDTTVLIATVSAGVGLFLMVSMLRILFRIPLKWLLFGLYIVVFILAALSNPDFLSVAFDSGGVTTGPMTVPFIMAIGVGVASIRSDENAKSDSFGLIALCSIGPILAVLLLGFLYQSNTAGDSTMHIGEYLTSVDVGKEYLTAFPDYMGEVAVALLPICLFFFLFQLAALKLKKRTFLTILIGILFTYVGLVLFLTGVNVGFSSLGYVLGGALVEGNLKWLLVPIAVLMGWFIINAEPAVHVLNKQVEELSAGAISEKVMGRTLSIAVAAAMGLAMVRVLTGISILWFMLAGYVIALTLAFFVKPTFTAIAFDAGGVASGPMTAAFMLPFAMGVSTALGGNVMTDAFGLVAMVAMMPLITVQIMGVITAVVSKRREAVQSLVSGFGEDETIELWEVS